MGENVSPEVYGVRPLEVRMYKSEFDKDKLSETVSRTLDVCKTAHVEKGLYMEFHCLSFYFSKR